MECNADYASDVTDRQWQIIERLLPKRSKVGRPPIDRREIVNAILYVVRTGCQWRMLPNDFPTWNTVYWNFWRWSRDGTWERIHDDSCGRKFAKRKTKNPHLPPQSLTASRFELLKAERKEALMPRKRSPDANDTLPSTRLV